MLNSTFGGNWMTRIWMTRIWMTRIVLSLVFALNISCALAFIARPQTYAPSFEVSGVAGEVLVRGIGILFLMWNATYPLAIWHPERYRWLFLIIIVQQAIGVIGEGGMLLALAPGHAALAATGRRFVAFDGGGLVAMMISFIVTHATRPQTRSQ
jgi:hypothetical protein